MKRLFLLMILGLSITGSAFAQSSSFSYKGFQISIQPIVSYQLLRRDFPEPHQKFLFMYGARATIGHPYLSGEVEYQKGSDTEFFPTEPLTVKEDREELKVGLRSKYVFGSIFDGTVRAGGQATRAEREEIRISGVTKKKVPTKIAPYVGFGLGVQFFQYLGLIAEATFVMPDLDKPNELEVQSSLALRIDIGTN